MRSRKSEKFRGGKRSRVRFAREARLFVTTVERALNKAEFSFKQPLLVAVSGGADSTALLLALSELASSRGFDITAAHLDHGLRGTESAADACFVKTLSRKYNIRCVMGSTNDSGLQGDSSRSPEDRAREIRYRFLEKTAREAGAEAITTGHTADDQAETILLHLARGTGLKGLGGIAPFSKRDIGDSANVSLIRPLLSLRRVDTEAFCAEMKVSPRQDSSNYDLSVPRNRIRAIVIPELRKINSSVIRALGRTASIARVDAQVRAGEAETVLALIIEKETANTVEIRRDGLNSLNASLVHHVLRAAFFKVSGTMKELQATHVTSMAQLVKGSTGSTLDLPLGIQFSVERNIVAIGQSSLLDDGCPYPSLVKQSELEPPCQFRIERGFWIDVAEVKRPTDLSAGAPWVSFVDASAVDRWLRVRSRRNGDVFHPLGLSHPKKLNDFFTDSQIPRAWRDRVPLVETKRGILWVAGCRPAEWGKLHNLSRNTLRLEMVGPQVHTHAID